MSSSLQKALFSKAIRDEGFRKKIFEHTGHSLRQVLTEAAGTTDPGEINACVSFIEQLKAQGGDPGKNLSDSAPTNQ